jgi:hypothetical protein
LLPFFYSLTPYPECSNQTTIYQIRAQISVNHHEITSSPDCFKAAMFVYLRNLAAPNARCFLHACKIGAASRMNSIFILGCKKAVARLCAAMVTACETGR